MNVGKLARTMAMAAVTVSAAGCPALVPVDDEMGGDGVPAVVQDRLDQYCAIPGCHAGTSVPDLRVGSSAAILDSSSPTTGLPFVTRGDIGASFLALKLLPDPPSGTIMPPPGNPPMPPEDVALILGWIAGADLGGADEMMTSSDGGDGGDGGDPSGDPTTGMPGDGADTMPGDSGGPVDGSVCSLSGVQPGASNPIDAGTGPTQIPVDVGDVLARNCGCHYATQATAPKTALHGAGYQPMDTLADFTGAYAGINSAAYGTGTGADAVYDRVVTVGNMPQPIICDLGDGTVISAEDLATLQTWLEAGTPGGAG